MRLLLVTDDLHFATVARSWLGLAGVDVTWIDGGALADPALRNGKHNCMVLDLGLRDIGAADLLRGLRGRGHQLPVVIVTSSEGAHDRVRLLDDGADDFLVKPIHLDELAARLRALLRRCGHDLRGQWELRHGNLRVVPGSRSVSKDGNYVPLTTKEYSLLETLMRGKGRVLTRERLEDALNGSACDAGSSNPIEVHVHHLRRKLGANVIKTVRGVGYALGLEG